jgi:hypothetical protein
MFKSEMWALAITAYELLVPRKLKFFKKKSKKPFCDYEYSCKIGKKKTTDANKAFKMLSKLTGYTPNRGETPRQFIDTKYGYKANQKVYDALKKV